MKSFLRVGVLTLAVAATSFGAIATADAGHRHRHNNSSDVIASGVLGLAAGAIVGGLISESLKGEGRVYIDPPFSHDFQPVYRERYPARPVYRERYQVRPVYRERPVRYRAAMEPWSREWFRYCANRYRSFDGRTGTFLGYDGHRHFCQPR